MKLFSQHTLATRVQGSSKLHPLQTEPATDSRVWTAPTPSEANGKAQLSGVLGGGVRGKGSHGQAGALPQRSPQKSDSLHSPTPTPLQADTRTALALSAVSLAVSLAAFLTVSLAVCPTVCLSVPGSVLSAVDTS